MDKLTEAAARLAWELTGTVAAYRAIYARHPGLASPVEIEDYMWQLYTAAMPLQGALDAAGVDWRGMGLARDAALAARR